MSNELDKKIIRDDISYAKRLLAESEKLESENPSKSNRLMVIQMRYQSELSDYINDKEEILLSLEKSRNLDPLVIDVAKEVSKYIKANLDDNTDLDIFIPLVEQEVERSFNSATIKYSCTPDEKEKLEPRIYLGSTSLLINTLMQYKDKFVGVEGYDNRVSYLLDKISMNRQSKR